MYVKMKELGPVGGGVRQKSLYVDRPMLNDTAEVQSGRSIILTIIR